MGIVNYPEAGTIGTTLLPQRYDISIYQGDTFEVNLVFKDSGQNPVNMTGWTALCEIKELDSETVISTPTLTITPASGILNLKIADTDSIPAGEYRYDVQLTDTSSNKRTYIGGKFIVDDDVSD